jgi:hypothetical protein
LQLAGGYIDFATLVVQTCTAREPELLGRELMRWLGRPATGDDDPVRAAPT